MPRGTTLNRTIRSPVRQQAADSCFSPTYSFCPDLPPLSGIKRYSQQAVNHSVNVLGTDNHSFLSINIALLNSLMVLHQINFRLISLFLLIHLRNTFVFGKCPPSRMRIKEITRIHLVFRQPGSCWSSLRNIRLESLSEG